MKPLSYGILICIGIYGNLVAGSVDSSARVTASDEDLILDDGPSTLVPALSPKKSALNAKDVIVPAAPPAGDTAGKKQASAIPPPVDKAASQGQAGTPKTAAKTEPKVKDTSKKIVDEELILDGGEEDLLGQTPKSPGKSTGTAPGNAVAANPDSSTDSTARAVMPVSGQNPNPSAATLPPAKAALSGKSPAPKTTPKIENAHSINFAANLKEYRSPKLAMLMSLCVPGSGQVYAKANWYAAGFLLVEAVIVGTGMVYSSKSNAQKGKAHKFADTAYSAGKFEQYTKDLSSYLTTNAPTRWDTIYSSIFFDSSDVLFLNDANKNPGKRSDNFYNDISGASSAFIRGWKDVAPDFSEGGFSVDNSAYHEYSSDSGYYVYRGADKADYRFGFSSYQARYNSMLDESRKLANYSRNAFVTLLINHLASAVMAGIEAKNHNDALLGRETFLRHVDIGQQFVNTGSETVAGYSVGVRF